MEIRNPIKADGMKANIHTLTEKLKGTHKRLYILETFLTGGDLVKRMTAPGSSDFIWGSVVTKDWLGGIEDLQIEQGAYIISVRGNQRRVEIGFGQKGISSEKIMIDNFSTFSSPLQKGKISSRVIQEALLYFGCKPEEIRKDFPEDQESDELDQTFQDAVFINNFALSHGLKIALMESCTGGELVSKFTNLLGANALHRGFVAYQPSQKVKLGLTKEDTSDYWIYSRKTAVAMVEALGKNFPSGGGIFISTTGRMDEWNEGEKRKNNIVYFAFSINGYTFFGTFNPKSNRRNLMKTEAADYILSELSHMLNEVSVNTPYYL